MWHDKQNAVLLERSSSLETPIETHKSGRKNRMRNAMIFPPRVAVASGRKKSATIKLTLKRMSNSRNETDAVT